MERVTRRSASLRATPWANSQLFRVSEIRARAGIWKQHFCTNVWLGAVCLAGGDWELLKSSLCGDQRVIPPLISPPLSSTRRGAISAHTALHKRCDSLTPLSRVFFVRIWCALDTESVCVPSDGRALSLILFIMHNRRLMSCRWLSLECAHKW
jgi:hypothetical protein